jgi:hypothetical protein
MVVGGSHSVVCLEKVIGAELGKTSLVLMELKRFINVYSKAC